MTNISTTKTVVPPDAEERVRAASRLDKNIIVTAGAGTGKTTLLVDRLALLILGGMIPVERIVALTFTKKAAEEMRERLEDRLRAIIRDPDGMPLLAEKFPESRPRWEEKAKLALDGIPKAQIGTIHSFAGHLLRLYPVQAGVDPKFREDEGDGFERVFESLWRIWLAEEFREGSPRAAFWHEILLHVTLDDLKDLSEALVSPMVDAGSLGDRYPYKDLVIPLADELAGYLAKMPIPEKATAFGPGISALEEVFEMLKAGEPVSEERKDRLKNLKLDRPPGLWSEVKGRLKELKKWGLALAEIDDDLIQKVLEGILSLVRRVREEMTRTGLVSFDGLLVSARNLVKNHPEVRQELKKKFDVFLVDEFQDTDPLQGEILFYLAENPASCERDWQKVQLGEGRLFVVGDPKQSIYRFRGADMAAFQAFQDQMVQQGALEAALSANFRSHETMLGSLNAIFPMVMKEEPNIQPAYAPLQAGKEGEKRDGLQMIMIQEDPDRKTKVDDIRRQEAERIAEWIHENVGQPFAGGTLAYRDCALLFRSSNVFEVYLEAMKKRGIPYLAEGEKFFYQTVEVTEFVNLVSAIADPEDRLALVGVLRSPLGGLTDAEILQLKRKNSLDYRHPPACLTEKIGPLYKTIRELSELAGVLPVGKLIQTIFNRTWVLELMSQSLYGDQALANIMKIGSLAEKWSEEAPLTLKAFVRRFMKYRKDDKAEGENPLADAHYNAVKVMTIHKAKGLEFPIVFLPNLCAEKTGGRDKPVVTRDWRTGHTGIRLPKARKINSFMPIIEGEIRKREDAEEVRVFYVASTRAKEKLVYLLRSQPPARSDYANFVVESGAWPMAGSDRRVLDGIHIPVETLPFQDMAPAPRGGVSTENLDQRWDPKALAASLRKREEEFERLKKIPLMMSPTLAMNVSQEEVEPWRVRDEETGIGVSHAVQLGILCHKVLEEWDFRISGSGLSRTLSKAVNKAAGLLGLVRGTGPADSVLKEAEEILLSYLKSPLREKLARANILGRELPFLYPLPEGKGETDPGPVLMRGSIDLLYELEGQLIVADYKTNRIEGKELSEVAGHYKIQKEAYLKAIRETLKREPLFELHFLRGGVHVPL